MPKAEFSLPQAPDLPAGDLRVQPCVTKACSVLIEIAHWFRRYAGASLTAIARNGQEKADACEAGAAALQSQDELLTALAALADDYERVIGDGVTAENEPPQLKAARAALAKAEAR